MIKTIVDLPDSFTGKMKITINDRDIHVAARNAVILLIAILVSNESEAIDCMIHIWYSAFLKPRHLSIMSAVRKQLLNFDGDAAGFFSDEVFSGTFGLEARSLRIELCKSHWDELLGFLEPTDALSYKEASRLRHATIVPGPDSIDIIHRKMYAQPPSRRVCEDFFSKDGVLLPLSHSRADHTVPNQ